MELERMESISSKLKKELFNGEEEFTGVELKKQLLNVAEEAARGEDGEINPGLKSIMNAVMEMVWESMKPFMHSNADKSSVSTLRSPAEALRDVFRNAAENAENEEE